MKKFGEQEDEVEKLRGEIKKLVDEEAGSVKRWSVPTSLPDRAGAELKGACRRPSDYSPLSPAAAAAG